jgi:anti-sigma regulatory factor (Ser/Thr protein kinase)
MNPFPARKVYVVSSGRVDDVRLPRRKGKDDAGAVTRADPAHLTGRRPVSTSSRVVSSHATAFVEARRFVRESVGPVPRRITEDAVLLTSELVTNAVRHAGLDVGDEIEVTVSVDADVLRITVRDRGPGFDPEAVASRRSDDGGWGLDLLRRLSSRWGVDRGEVGTDVWFEIDLPDGSGI